MRNIFIIGAKNIGQYGGFETFLDRLIAQHKDNENIRYYIIVKQNGIGNMDESKLNGIKHVSEHSFIYNNARITKLTVPQIGSAQAIVYDVKALRYCINYCKKKNINDPVFYVLACRIGPFIRIFVNKAHKISGKVYVNPDGQEWKRDKWSGLVKKYWKYSERLMVKHADLLICDSVNIEKYIKEEYGKYSPKTTYIAYGSDLYKSKINDDDPVFINWLKKNHVKPGQYYVTCGRFVPENSFDIMIREFIISKSEKDYVIITTNNQELYNQIDESYDFTHDSRIKFVGTVYDAELLKKIRENAYANIHGHTVGGTNPSLLEAMASTDVNMLIDVGFNREVALDTALYWNSEKGNLSDLINHVDKMDEIEREAIGINAKKRIAESYSWEYIANQYEKIWLED